MMSRVRISANRLPIHSASRRSPNYTIQSATEQETEQQGLEDLVDEQADATGLIDTLLGKIRRSQELTFNDENLMQQVLENQKQIEQRAKQLVEDMQQTAEIWSGSNSSTLRRYRSIRNSKN